jgi:hypothetical protein
MIFSLGDPVKEKRGAEVRTPALAKAAFLTKVRRFDMVVGIWAKPFSPLLICLLEQNTDFLALSRSEYK